MINMLAITEATSIAIHLCVRLTKTGDEFYSTRLVAEELGLSIHHVAKVVQKLVKAKFLYSSRGKMGGVKLRMKPEAINLADLHMTVVDTERGYCLLSPKVCEGTTCSFGTWMREENERIFAVLKNTTIQAVAASIEDSKNSNSDKSGTTHEA